MARVALAGAALWGVLFLGGQPVCAQEDPASAPATPPAALPLAAQAARVLQRYCLRCHTGPGSSASFDVRSAGSLTDNGVITPGKPADSLAWQLVHRGTMPPASQPQLPRPTPAEAQLLADWIHQGADAFPAIPPRPAIAPVLTLTQIRDDLRQIPDPLLRARTRYFSLATLHNQPAVRDEALQLARAALPKLLNSLSWQPRLAALRPVDPLQTLFAVDFGELGWSRQHWTAIRTRYPYVVGYANLDDQAGQALHQLDREIQSLMGNSEPLYLVRGDWFTATASQPALYHALLYDLSLPVLRDRLPNNRQPDNPKQMTATDLEQFLDVDPLGDLLGVNPAAGAAAGTRALRAGFTSSGVSRQNRMLERHASRYGAYWKSYDFRPDNRRSFLTQFPLGPVFPGNRFRQLAFEHDGGEIIYHLPNGLQGYLLIDGQENRINAGPIEVVSDALQTSGTPLIVNGLSCIACHRHGMIEPPTDEIRLAARLLAEPRQELERLYVPPADFEAAWKQDQGRFLVALEATCGPLLKQGADATRELTEFPEPVGETARAYLLEELDLATVAAELHEPNEVRLRQLLQLDEALKELGLRVLLSGKIKRAYWEGQQDGISVMQQAATALGYTAPRFLK